MLAVMRDRYKSPIVSVMQFQTTYLSEALEQSLPSVVGLLGVLQQQGRKVKIVIAKCCSTLFIIIIWEK